MAAEPAAPLAACGSLRLAAEGLTSEQLARLLRGLSRRLVEAGDAPLVIAAAGIDRAGWAALLDGAARGVVEWTEADQLAETINDLLCGADQPGLFLCLSTRAAFHCDVAQLIGGALERILALPPDQALGLRLALTEAVANAIIHGNLQLDSSLRADPERFMEFSRLLSDRLAETERGLRPLAVDCHWGGPRLNVAVLDVGDGFDATQLQDDVAAPSGRGLKLMRSLAAAVRITRGGRRVVLDFDR